VKPNAFLMQRVKTLRATSRQNDDGSAARVEARR
jgi:hypothetical protein